MIQLVTTEIYEDEMELGKIGAFVFMDAMPAQASITFWFSFVHLTSP